MFSKLVESSYHANFKSLPNINKLLLSVNHLLYKLFEPSNGGTSVIFSNISGVLSVFNTTDIKNTVVSINAIDYRIRNTDSLWYSFVSFCLGVLSFTFNDIGFKLIFLSFINIPPILYLIITNII